MKRKMADLFKETIPSILLTKDSVIDESNEKDYVPFIVNRALSFHYDCIMQANAMNAIPNIDRLLQYHYLLNTVRSRKRPFQKWLKRETTESLEAIKEYYQCSNEKAKEIMMVLTEGQIKKIQEKLDKGGLKNAKSRGHGMGGAS